MHATKFNGIIDELGLSFSERWARDNNGEWCYGKISFVYKKKSRETQKYRILYHDGTTMLSLEADVEEEMADDTESEGEQRDRRERELHGEDIDEDSTDNEDEENIQGVTVRANRARRRRAGQIEAEDTGTVEVEESDKSSGEEEDVVVGGVHYQVGKRKRNGADVVAAVEDANGTDLKIGDTVQVGNMTWKRIEGLEEDARRVPHFDTTFKTNLFHEGTVEADVSMALLPLSKTQLLAIVRQNVGDCKYRKNWVEWHIDAALAIIFGGAQFKEGTELWATRWVDAASRLRSFLSQDRFSRILRYWARGLQDERDKLRDNSWWAQIDPWVSGFNAARLREIRPGTLLTPDEMMMEWRGGKWVRGLAAPVVHQAKA